MRKVIILMLVALVILFILNILIGSVDIPAINVLRILAGKEEHHPAWQYIILESRLPQAITAIVAGAGLSVTGILLQTLFKNPLAGPDVFGISSGAALAVAIVMLGTGGSAIALSITGTLSIIAAAFIGAMIVTGIIFLFANIVHNNVMLLIIGMMIGYIAGSAISLLNYVSTAEGVRSYMIWGMGTFSNVTLNEIPFFCTVILLFIVFAIFLAKPLNALLLGENYAMSLGVNIRFLRRVLLILTGGLTAIITAYCGPISFLGLATPHLARLLLQTDDHRVLIPCTALTGATIASLCSLITILPANGTILPLSAITPLLCAPIIIYIIVR